MESGLVVWTELASAAGASDAAGKLSADRPQPGQPSYRLHRQSLQQIDAILVAGIFRRFEVRISEGLGYRLGVMRRERGRKASDPCSFLGHAERLFPKLAQAISRGAPGVMLKSIQLRSKPELKCPGVHPVYVGRP
jgi:hypothetical protein